MTDFKFKWIDNNGNEQGFFSKKGHFDGEDLCLDDTTLPAAALLDLDIRGKRMIFSCLGESNEPVYVVVAITKGSPKALKQQIGVARSAAWANFRKEELQKEGRGHEFRAVECPHCTATIDLTGFPQTPQISCEFCHALGTIPQQMAEPIRGEKDYRLCDECGMYSKPLKFTIFYFYFLLVVYGYWQKETWRCPGCMRGEAWKMLFGNLIFIVGVPVALVQLFRSYGGSSLGSLYPGLDSANLKARSGKLNQAIESYQKIVSNHPVSAGVKYNIGLALLNDNSPEKAAKMFEFALTDCANYRPAASMLAGCYESLNDTGNLQVLQKQWGTVEEEEAAEAIDE